MTNKLSPDEMRVALTPDSNGNYSCPFCGGKAKRFKRTVQDGVAGRDLCPHNPTEAFYRTEEGISCERCGCIQHWEKWWNQRLLTASLVAEIRDLREILQQADRVLYAMASVSADGIKPRIKAALERTAWVEEVGV